MEGRGEVGGGGGVGVNIGWVTLPHPTLPYGVQVGYQTDHEMKCVGVGVNIGWGTLPWGDRSEHWVGTLPYPTAYPTPPYPTLPSGLFYCSSNEMPNF